MNKNDLRYLKTEKNLKSAYLTLIEEKPCHDITVKDICKQAQCSRNTFYLHYEVKEDLYQTIMADILDNLADAFETRVSHISQVDDSVNRAYTNSIIDSISRNKKAIGILAARDKGLFLKQFTDTIFDKCMLGSQQLSKKGDSTAVRLNNAYLASSIAGFIFEWLKHPDISSTKAKELLFTIHRQTMETCYKAL